MRKFHVKVLLSTLLLLILATTQFGWLDQTGKDYTEQGLKRALLTYGVARGLNGLISVAQGTEVAVEPVGVGMTFTPGQILDPVNDLVERFSWVVLASGASLGVQRVLLEMSAWVWFSGLVSLMLVAVIVVTWKPALCKIQVRNLIYKITLAMLILRFAIPVIAIINEGIYYAFLQPQYEASRAVLEQTTDQVKQLSEQPASTTDDSFVEKVQKIYTSAVSALNMQQQLDDLKQTVSEISESTLNIMVVFVVQTIIFPLLFLWLAIKLFKQVIHLKFGNYEN